MPGYVIYLDGWLLRLLANFLFELLLLWSVREVTRISAARTRLWLGAAIGTIHYLLFLMSSYRLIPHYGLLRSFPVILVVSVIMLLVTFYPKTKGKKLLVVLAYFYGIGFFSGGAGMAAAYIFGTPQNPQYLAGMLVSIAVMLIIAELGWGVIQRKIYETVYHLPVKIALAGKSIEIIALVDTGNKLHDPLTKQPVIVVECEALLSMFEPAVAEIFDQLETGNMDAVNDISSSSLASRIRVIPFNTLGTSNGMLVGFRPDYVELVHDGQAITITNTIIAIYKNTLDPDGQYHALIPLEVLDSHASMTTKSEQSIQGGEAKHGIPTHTES